MMSSLLARELLEEEPRQNFQKAVAMVNEPSACYSYSRAFLHGLLGQDGLSKKDQLLRLRQAYICLNAVTTWAIQDDNLESIYNVSELGIFLCWNIVRSQPKRKCPTKHDRELNVLLNQFVNLYLACSECYLEKIAYQHAHKLHALSVSVQSIEAVDVNLALFELLGRLAIRGIWTSFLAEKITNTESDFLHYLRKSTQRTLDTLVHLINSNPTLNSPFKDDHMIEIALVMYLAQMTDTVSRFEPWLISVANNTTIALMLNKNYPICKTDYHDLLNHPSSAEQAYRDDVCAGSILYPYLFFWLHRFGNEHHSRKFIERLTEWIPACTHQAWLPDKDTDQRFWLGNTDHGICITDVSPLNGINHVVELLNLAIENCMDINDLSAVRSDLKVLFLAACRHYRMPIPPHFWFVGS